MKGKKNFWKHCISKVNRVVIKSCSLNLFFPLYWQTCSNSKVNAILFCNVTHLFLSQNIIHNTSVVSNNSNNNFISATFSRLHHFTSNFTEASNIVFQSHSVGLHYVSQLLLPIGLRFSRPQKYTHLRPTPLPFISIYDKRHCLLYLSMMFINATDKYL